MARIVKDPVERKSDIITAARELFAGNGYANTSMQDVMMKLKIAKGTIYHYFKSKDELLEAVVESMVNDSVAQMEAMLESSSGDALAKFKLLVGQGNISIENKELLEHLHAPENAGMHTRLLAVAVTKQSGLYARVIAQGCEEGTFKTDFPLESAEFILSAFQFLTDVGLYPWSNQVLKRRMGAFPRLIEQQLNAPAGSFQFLSNP